MSDYKIIDSDGHIIESVEGIRKYIDPKFDRPRLFGGDTWDRNLHDKLGANPQSPQEQLDAMDPRRRRHRHPLSQRVAVPSLLQGAGLRSSHRPSL